MGDGLSRARCAFQGSRVDAGVKGAIGVDRRGWSR